MLWANSEFVGFGQMLLLNDSSGPKLFFLQHIVQLSSRRSADSINLACVDPTCEVRMNRCGPRGLYERRLVQGSQGHSRIIAIAHEPR